MNKKHIQIVIDVMTRVRDQGRAFDFSQWQGFDYGDDPVITERELHTCGSPACVGGWLAVSPEFAAVGGSVGECGQPIYREEEGVTGPLSRFLDIPFDVIEALFAYTVGAATGTIEAYKYLCGVSFEEVSDITPAHVVEAFTKLRDTPELAEDLAY